MAEQTNDLKLFKYNTATDGKEVFSIEKSMNENWDKIDAFSSAIKSLSNLDAVGEKRFTDINTALSKKLEAEVLLAENGYIKFNNGLIIAFIFYLANRWINYPITFKIYPTVATSYYNGANECTNPPPPTEVHSRTYSQIFIRSTNNWSGSMILIGY